MTLGVANMSNGKSPKEYTIPSRSWPITAQEAADTLIAAKEIQGHRELNKAALKILREKKKTVDKIV
jgi:hypothetical protein